MAESQDIEQQDPPTKKLGVKEFAAKIKAKYPDYAGIDDSTLVQKIITKYPEYKEQVDFSQKKNSLPTSSPVSAPSSRQSVSAAPSTAFDPATFMRQSRAATLEKPVQDNTASVAVEKSKQAIDTNMHGEERKVAKQKLREEAITNATEKYLKNKGINAPVGSAPFNQQKAKIEEMVDNGDAHVARDNDGTPGLKRVTGFIDNLVDGWNAATKGAEEANEFTNNMTAAQRVEYLKKNELEKPSEFIGERPSLLGSTGHFLGEAGPFLGKAAVGGAIGTGAIMAAPETMGASLAGLPVAMGFILTAPDMANQGAQAEIIRRYQILKSQNPEMDDVAAMEEAGNGALSGGIGGILTNAALMGTGLKTPLSMEAKGVVGKTLQQIAKSGVHMGGISAGVTAGQQLEGELEGIHTSTKDKIDATVESFKQNATVGAMLTTLMHGVPKIMESAIKFALKDTKPQEIRNVLQANENIGTVPEGTTEKVMADIKGYNEALSKTVEGLTPESQASIAGLIQAKTKLVEEAKTKDSSAKPIYKEKIDAIDRQIAEIQKTNEPFKSEIDEATGEVYQKPAEIESAVVEINGKTYEGKNHAEAILKAKQAGVDISQVDRQGQGKFKLSDGTIIDRAEAKKRFGQDRAELLIPQDEAAKQANADYRKITNPPPKISELTDSEVVMNGERGRLKTDEENNVVFNNGQKETLLGKTTDEKFNNSDASEHGIKPVPKVEVKGDNVKIDGEDVTLQSFNKDNDGNLVSLTVKNSKGEARTMRDKDLALDVAIAKNHEDFNSRPEPKDYEPTQQVVRDSFKEEHGKEASDVIDRMPDEVADTFAAMDNKIEALAPRETQEMVIRASEWADQAREEIKNSSSSEKEKADAIKMLDKFDKDLNKYYGKLEKQRKSQANADVKREQAESLGAAKQKARAAREKAKQLEIEAVEQENLATTTESRNRTYKRVNEIDDPTDAQGIALQYFAGGNKVDVGEMAGEVTGSRKTTMNREGKTSDADGNTLFEKDGRTVDQIAHSLWDNLPEYLQDNVTTQDIRNSLIDVMGSHGSRFDAAKEFVEKYHPEFVEAKYAKEQQEQWAEYEKQFEKEREAEVEWLKDQSNQQKEIEETPEYIEQIIKKYESEATKRDVEPPVTKGEGESPESRSPKKSAEPEGDNIQRTGKDKPEPTKGRQESAKGEVKAGDFLRNFADIVDKGKISKLGGFKSSTGFDAVWDGSLAVVSKVLRETANLADAIQAGLNHIKQTDWYKNLNNKKEFDEKYVAHLEGEYGKYVKEQPIDPAHPGYKPLGTGIKNEVVNNERTSQGKEPLKSSGDGTMERAEQTKAKIESGEISEEHIRDLTQALATGDKDFLTNLAPEEIQHVLLFDRQTLQNKRSEIEAELIGAKETKNDAAIERILMKQAQNDLLMEANDKADNKTGRSWSDVGRARQLMIRNDYTFEALKRKAKAASKDGVLDKASEERFRELSKQIEQKDAQLFERNEAIAAADKEIAELKELVAAEKENRLSRKDEISAFDDLKKETKSQVKSQGRRTIERIKHDRENIKASLKNKWKNHVHGSAGMNNIIPVDMVSDLVKLAKSYIEEGLAIGKEAVLEHIIDRVHRDVVEAIGDIDKTSVRDAITGYGKIKKPNHDPVETAFRDIAAQGRLVSGIELAQKGEPPLKSGQQRDKPTAEQRKLQKELNKAIKDNNIQVKSPEEQIKTSLDAAKTRLKNQIEDLTDAIDKNEKIVKDRKGIEYDKEANDLKAERDKLRDEYDEIFGTKNELTNEERIERSIKAVERSIEKLDERIANKDFSQNKRIELSNPKLDGLKKQREELRKVYKYLMDAEGETNRRKVEALKKNIAKRTKFLKEIIETQDLDKFIKSKERVKTVLDESAKTAKAELKKLQSVVDNMMYQREFANLNRFQRGQYWAGRFGKGVLISSPVVLARIIGSVAFRGVFKAPTALSTYLWTKMLPKSITYKAITESFHTAKDLKSHLAEYYSVLFSKENYKEMIFAFKNHATKADLILDKSHKDIPIPKISSKNPLLLPQKAFFKSMELLTKNASAHGALKSLASNPEQRAYEITIASNFIREGITPETVGEPVFKEMVNQLAYFKSRRAKFMQDNYVQGMQKSVEQGLRQKGLHGTAEVVNMTLPITLIASNYLSEGMTKIPVVGALAAKKQISESASNFLHSVSQKVVGEKAATIMFGEKTQLTEKDASILMRTLAYQGVGMMSYAIGWMMSSHIAPFYKSPANQYAKEQKEGEESWFERLWETLSHSPDALVMQAGATHHYFWQKYDEENPNKEFGMTTFMDKVIFPMLSNEQMVAGSSPYFSSPETVIAPLVTGKSIGKAAANFVKQRIPFSTTAGEIAQGKIPVLNKLGVISDKEEKVKPFEVGVYPKGFVDNFLMGVPHWRQEVLKKYYYAEPVEKTDEELDAEDRRADEKEAKKEQFEKQLER